MMWPSDEYFRATRAATEKEVTDHLQARSAYRVLHERTENHSQRAWQWRIAPGMEDTFRDLLAWFFPRQERDEPLAAEAENEIPPVCTPACCCW